MRRWEEETAREQWERLIAALGDEDTDQFFAEAIFKFVGPPPRVESRPFKNVLHVALSRACRTCILHIVDDYVTPMAAPPCDTRI
jgi:hypothetical protein